jgi:hypothetical protein
MAEIDDEEPGGKLPAITSPKAWWKIIGIMALMVLVNVVAFLVSFGAGIIATIPLTLFLAFLLLRDIVPSHRFPPGRPPRGVPQ